MGIQLRQLPTVSSSVLPMLFVGLRIAYPTSPSQGHVGKEDKSRRALDWVALGIHARGYVRSDACLWRRPASFGVILICQYISLSVCECAAWEACGM